jgi:hypothetical protein
MERIAFKRQVAHASAKETEWIDAEVPARCIPRCSRPQDGRSVYRDNEDRAFSMMEEDYVFSRTFDVPCDP